MRGVWCVLCAACVRACVRAGWAGGCGAGAGRMAQTHGTNTRSNTNAVRASACHCHIPFLFPFIESLCLSRAQISTSLSGLGVCKVLRRQQASYVGQECYVQLQACWRRKVFRRQQAAPNEIFLLHKIRSCVSLWKTKRGSDVMREQGGAQ